MLTPRRAAERGHAHHGWLDTRHTFSFADYYDPRHMGFRALRVINDDRVSGGAGFPPHSHRDMDIVTYVLDGALEHRDSMGNGSVIRPGDVQRMSAGTGVTHSEYNHSKTDPVRFLQIWIIPSERALPPSYEQKTFTEAEKRGRLRLVASPDAAEGSVRLHQDARLYAAVLHEGDRVRHELAPDRHAYLQVARGKVKADGLVLEEGDGGHLSGPGSIELVGVEAAELLLFDLG